MLICLNNVMMKMMVVVVDGKFTLIFTRYYG